MSATKATMRTRAILTKMSTRKFISRKLSGIEVQDGVATELSTARLNTDFFIQATLMCRKSEGIFFLAVSLAASAQWCNPMRRQELATSKDHKKMDSYGDDVNSESDECHCRCMESICMRCDNAAGLFFKDRWRVYISVTGWNEHEVLWCYIIVDTLKGDAWDARDSMVEIRCACPKSDSALLHIVTSDRTKNILAPNIICIPNVQPGRTCKISPEVHIVRHQFLYVAYRIAHATLFTVDACMTIVGRWL